MSSWWTHITEEDAYNGGQEGRRGRESGEVEEDRNELGKRMREREREQERQRDGDRERNTERMNHAIRLSLLLLDPLS